MLGDDIKQIRKEKGLTQKQLAKATEISVRTLQRFESGDRSPDYEFLKKLYVALGVSSEAPNYDKKIEAMTALEALFEVFTRALNDSVDDKENEKRFQDYIYKSEEGMVDKQNAENMLENIRLHNDPEYKKAMETEVRKDILVKHYFDQLNDKGLDETINFVKILATHPEFKK